MQHHIRKPFGIYPGTKTSLDDIAKGDTIAIPNDTTNEARALLLLQDNNIITLKDGAGLTSTVNDIKDNPYDIKFLELDAAQIALQKQTVTLSTWTWVFCFICIIQTGYILFMNKDIAKTIPQWFVNRWKNCCDWHYDSCFCEDFDRRIFSIQKCI